MTNQTPPPKGERRFLARGTLGREVVLVLFSVAVTSAITFGLVPWINSLGRPAPLPEQLESIRSAAANNGLEVVDERVVDLRGTGEQAHLFVLRDASRRHLPSATRRPPRSDEIRLYSNESGSLALSFHFRAELGKGAGTDPVSFNLVSVSDVDGNGRPEIVGFFTPWAVDSLEASPFPVVISWVDAEQAFRMFPLVDRPLRDRQQVGPRGAWGRGVIYRERSSLTDRETGETVRGYKVLGFATTTTPLGEPAILTSYVAKAKCHFCGGQIIEVRISTASFQPPPQVSECVPRHQSRKGMGILVHLPARELVIARPSAYLSENASRFARAFECP